MVHFLLLLTGMFNVYFIVILSNEVWCALWQGSW